MTSSEAKALRDAAEMIDARRLPPEALASKGEDKDQGASAPPAGAAGAQ